MVIVICWYLLKFIVSLTLKFRKHDEKAASSLWAKKLLRYNSQIYLDAIVVNEIDKGLQLGFQLGLATEVSFNSHRMISFLVDVKDMRCFTIVM